MALKEVELIRRRVTNGLARELHSLRIFVSSTAGNNEAVEKLRDRRDEQDPNKIISQEFTNLLSVLTDTVLHHLGHDAEADPLSAGSRAMRAAKKQARA